MTPRGPTPSMRVASLSPAASEFLLLVEAGDRVVAVDTESARLPAFAGLPVTDEKGVASFQPDLVLVPAGLSTQALARIGRGGAEIFEFAPRNLEDVNQIFRNLGARLVGVEAARGHEVRLSRALARVGGESSGAGRLRTLAVTGLSPLEFAGAHSFETDLLEIAGAESLTHTHGGDDERVSVSSSRIRAYAPELILVMTRLPLPPAERARVSATLGGLAPVDFMALDARAFWVEAPVKTARRVQQLIKGHASRR
ncbi:MAG: ABC transporter substrate-binding protein [Myxococcota bacterium]|nr:ABC transporter substrate-binding protein [Myxococcota bacterium]